MAEININIVELELSISRLQNIRTACESNTAIPSIVGGGKTVGEIESIAEVYRDLNTSLIELVSNTIVFFRM